MPKSFLPFVATGLVALSSAAAVQAGPPKSPPVRIRGTIQSVSAQTLVVATATGPTRIQLAPNSAVVELIPSDRAHVKPGSFLGITSVEQPDGSQRAVEIHVFPESMRGAGEGSYPWDWPGPGGSGHSAPHSRMTNGTVSASHMGSSAPHSRMTNGTVAKGAGGSALTLTYKGTGGAGQQAITIPSGIPIVTFVPGTKQDLKPGAHVFVIAARQANGTLIAARVAVGKNGLTPPM